MIFQTKRLTIRELAETDIDHIHRLHSLPETDEFNTLGIPDSIQTTGKLVAEWVAGQTARPRISYVFCIELVDTHQFIGLIALIKGKPAFRNAEVWYKIHVAHWQNGYATEALAKLIEVGFNELNLHRIEAGCAVENTASGKVLQKAGMTKEGRKRKNLPIRGEWKDAFSYAILDEDYLK